MKSVRGFSLIESAVAIAVLGIVVVGAVAFWKMSVQQQVAVAQRDMLVRADDALTGFAFANFRLPCPDTNASGLENCTGTAALGGLPWKTLGLAEAGANNIKYGIYRKANAASPWLDADLATAKDRFRPLYTLNTTGTPLAVETLLLKSNGLDFCFALNTAASSVSVTPDRTAVNTVSWNKASNNYGTHYNVAYALALPGLLDADGDGNVFDGLQATQTAASPAFDSPQRPISATYDDKVLAQGFDALFSKLSCGQALAAAGHSHFNAAAAAVLTGQALTDYKKQLDIAALLAGAAVASATAGVLTATAGVATSAAGAANSVALTILSYGTTSGIIAAAAFDVATNAAAVVAALGSEAAAIAVQVLAAKDATDVIPMVTDAGTLAASITTNALAADAAGL